MYLYTYTYICIYTHKCTYCIHIYIYTYVHNYIHMQNSQSSDFQNSISVVLDAYFQMLSSENPSSGNFAKKSLELVP
jgi:hypothetical protein